MFWFIVDYHDQVIAFNKQSSNHFPTRDSEDSNLAQDKRPYSGYFDKFSRRWISCAYVIFQPCDSGKFSNLWQTQRFLGIVLFRVPDSDLDVLPLVPPTISPSSNLDLGDLCCSWELQREPFRPTAILCMSTSPAIWLDKFQLNRSSHL